MKILAIADTHTKHWAYTGLKADLLIYAGDINAFTEEDVAEFNNWLGKQDCRHKVVIAGNHDKILDKMPESSKYITNAIYLNNSGCEIEGVKIWGSPYTPEFMDWYFMAERHEIQKYWDLIPPDTQILVTHGPPYGILDYVPYTYQPEHHVGCQALLNTVNRIKPKYHFFGHIHGCGSQIEKKNGTSFINCSVLDEDYFPTWEPFEINF